MFITLEPIESLEKLEVQKKMFIFHYGGSTFLRTIEYTFIKYLRLRE